GDRRAPPGVLVVVCHHEPAAAVLPLAEDVQLDHVDAMAARRVEAGERVARLDVGRALVTHAPRASSLGLAAHESTFAERADPARDCLGQAAPCRRSIASTAALGPTYGASTVKVR